MRRRKIKRKLRSARAGGGEKKKRAITGVATIDPKLISWKKTRKKKRGERDALILLYSSLFISAFWLDGYSHTNFALSK